MTEKMPLTETAKFGKFGKREGVDSAATEVRWARHIRTLPDVEAKVERVIGRLPWTHGVEFENDGIQERWLLRGFSPLAQLPGEHA